jgi:CRISPR-associated protein Csm4
MTMQTETCRLTLQPRSAFGTPIVGDTLFGQLCWAIRERYGEQRLTELLDGYTGGRPFLVVSDAFPDGRLPRPQLPDFFIGLDADPAQRKLVRQRVWLHAEEAGLPLQEWISRAESGTHQRHEVLTQNTINRLTGTTGNGPFAPRQVERIGYAANTRVDVYCVVDTSRLAVSELVQILTDVGHVGYGRDASTGLGKFDVAAHMFHRWPVTASRHALTLAPCAPDTAQLEAGRCFYQPLTRFGRHGNIAVLTGEPFKRPVLMMRTAAFLTFREPVVPPFFGTGLGGTEAPISAAIPATVHQGYAPLIPLHAELRP